MIMAMFARADHPAGYGVLNGTTTRFQNGETKTDTSSVPGAHGYSVVVIKCRDINELFVVKEWFQYHHFDLPDNTSGKLPVGRAAYQWYGGKFDFLGSIDCDNEYIFNNNGDMRSYNSYGDNRFFGIYRAEEVLEHGQMEYECLP